jgi:hypothetical protein
MYFLFALGILHVQPIVSYKTRLQIMYIHFSKHFWIFPTHLPIYITLHSPDPRLVKMAVGCGISYTNTKTHIQYNWSSFVFISCISPAYYTPWLSQVLLSNYLHDTEWRIVIHLHTSTRCFGIVTTLHFRKISGSKLAGIAYCDRCHHFAQPV